MTIKQQGGIFGRNPTFNDVTVDGTLTVNGEPISDFGTMAQQDANNVNIDGGAIDGTTIGGTTPAAITGTTGVFGVTSLSASNNYGTPALGTGSANNFSAFHVEAHASGSANGPYIGLIRSQGTQASPTNLSSGDYIGVLTGQAFQTAGSFPYRDSAAIRFVADAAHSSTSLPSRIEFLTTAASSTTPTERMRIDSSGRLLVNTTIASGSSAPLVSRGGITVTDGAATQRGITQEIVTGASGTFTTITVSFDGDNASGSLIVEILMTGFSGVYLDYVAGVYAGQADVVMRDNSDAGTSVALTGSADSSWTATITTSVTHPVVKVKATAGGLTSSFVNAPTVTFA